MLRLSIRSLRSRATSFAAAFVTLFLGAIILTGFASLLDTGIGTDVPSSDRTTLITMASVAGGWCLAIVLFGVVSATGLAVRGRAREMALLRSAGATPRQVRRMVVGESVLVAIVAAGLAAGPGLLIGRLIVSLLRDGDQLAPGVEAGFGRFALGIGVAGTIAAAAVAASIASRRVARARVVEAAEAMAPEPVRLSRRRKIAGWAFMGLAVESGVLAMTGVMGSTSADAQSASGSSSIWAAIGFALFAPALVRRTVDLVAGPLRRRGGAGGELAVASLRRRASRAANVLTPIVLFTGIATGTLVMQRVDDAAAAAAGVARTADDKAIATLNGVVVGMIALFAAMMLVNTLIATVADRRRELAQLRLAGATPRQLVGSVALECAVLASAGVVLGSIAALATIVPFTVAVTDGVWPTVGAGAWIGVVVVAVVLTVGTVVLAARRTLRDNAARTATATLGG